jgi:hypothetical protein
MVQHAALTAGRVNSRASCSRLTCVACGLIYSVARAVAPSASTTPYMCQHLCKLLCLPAVQVACGARHTVVRTASGQAWAWGANKHGQLGVGDCTQRLVPQPMLAPVLAAGQPGRAAAAGSTGSQGAAEGGASATVPDGLRDAVAVGPVVAGVVSVRCGQWSTCVVVSGGREGPHLREG